MSQALSPSAQKVQAALAARGYAYQVTESAHVTRTAAEAAEVVGCTVGQIAKSLVFHAVSSGQPVLVIASGANRVNEAQIATYLGEPIGKANAAFVREQTGFAIGGVPPLGHLQPLTIFVDQDLLQYPEIWAAAGTPNALFRLDPHDLPMLTGGSVVAVT
jgi:prolyl-tRNA editing enzyme YbaK/EbsC (Cys-tRNA(Pro) deacylase)